MFLVTNGFISWEGCTYWLLACAGGAEGYPLGGGEGGEQTEGSGEGEDQGPGQLQEDCILHHRPTIRVVCLYKSMVSCYNNLLFNATNLLIGVN